MLHMPSFMEMMVIMVIGLLLFGKRLPEVGKSLGKGIVEFKKGLKGIEDDINPATPTQQPMTRLPDQQTPASALPTHKFDPYTGKPIEQTTSV